MTKAEKRKIILAERAACAAECEEVMEWCAGFMRNALNDEAVIDWSHRRKAARLCVEKIKNRK